MSTLSIIVPAFNEAEGIGETLRALRAGIPTAEVVVVDDGSSDATQQRASECDGVRVVHHAFNRGYGAALKTGMAATSGEMLAWFDADGEHGTDDLLAMAGRLEKENLGAVIGSRINPGRSPMRRLGKFAIRMLARSLGMRTGSDFNCGLRVFRRDVIWPYRSVLPDGFSASMTSTMVMLVKRYPIAFHPVTVAPRVGSSKVALMDGFASLMLVLRTMLLFAPLRFFLGGGALLFGLGLFYGVTMAWLLGQGLPVAALFLMNAGMILTMLGLVADQISQIRLSALEPQESSRESGSDDRPSS